jgi:serine protease Do
LAINGRDISDPEALRFRIATLPVGGTADLTIWRRDRERRLRVDLVAPPEDPPRETTEMGGANPLSGTTVANMSPALAEELGLDAALPGVYVLEVRRGTAAKRLGFQPGDSVLAINGTEIETVRVLRAVLAEPASRWRIQLRRGGQILNWIINR